MIDNLKAEHSKRYLHWPELAQEIHALGQHLLEVAALDKAVGTAIPLNAAKVLDSCWLYTAVHAFFCMRDLLQGEFEGEVGATHKLRVPADFEDLSRFLQGEDLADVFRGLRNGNFDVEVTFQPPKTRDYKAKIRRAVTLWIALVQKLFFPPRIAAIGMYHLTRVSAKNLKIRKKGVYTFSQPFEVEAKSVSRELRRSLVDLFLERLQSLQQCSLSSSDKCALAHFLTLSTPVSHLESRCVNFDKAKRIAERFPSSKVLQAIALYSKSEMFLVGAYVGRGSVLIGHQHGGYYGYSKTHSIIYNVEGALCDYFLSWGWEEWPKDVASPKATVVPKGSIYLKNLRRKGKESVHRRTPSKALFCPTFYPSRPFRIEIPYDSDLGQKYMWPTNGEFLSSFLKRNQLELTCKFHGDQTALDYGKVLAESLSASGQTMKVIPSRKPAWCHFKEYDVIIWDSLGTGFFESIAFGIPTFLVPSARIIPELIEGLTVSPWFYLDYEPESIMSIDERFQLAVHESASFLERFGKHSDADLEGVVETVLGLGIS